MRRKDIEVGQEYAVRSHGSVAKSIARQTDKNSVYMTLGSGFYWVGYRSILMPWAEWEAEERARKERDALVQKQKDAHDFAAWSALHKRLADAQIDPVCVDGKKRTITMHWEDLARLIGVTFAHDPRQEPVK